ncbi:MAG: phosphoenolpyruvate--protein phosphotransferase [Faecalibacterium sp.]
MKVYKGISASPGLVMGQVSRLEHHTELSSGSPLDPEREQQLLTDAIRTAQEELRTMSERSGSSEQAIFLFQSMMLEDESFLDEVRSYIAAGSGAAAAIDRVGQRYADQLAGMKDNPYLQLRSVDILDATLRVVNILSNRPREWMALDHPVVLAADLLMPSDLFSVPSGMILGIVTSEGSSQSHAAIIARAMNIPGIVQVGRDFLDDCDGRTCIVDATVGEFILDPDSAARQQAVTRICEMQRENEELSMLRALPCRTRDGAPFELLANCFGPEDIDSALQAGAYGVGLLRSGYLMLPNRSPDEQEQYFFYTSCLSAAQGCAITVRTFDFGSDRTLADVYRGPQSSHLGLRGIRNSLRQPRQLEAQICALLRAGARGPLRVVFPMVTDVEDWDAAMKVVERCRCNLRERGVAFNPDVPFGVMLSIPSACLTAEDFIRHGCSFFVIGTNDLTQYTHAADRELTSAERYYRPASPAMKKLISMAVEAADQSGIPVTICGLAVGNPVNAVQYLQLGLRSFSLSPQNLLEVKRALLDADAMPKEEELEY